MDGLPPRNSEVAVCNGTTPTCLEEVRAGLTAVKASCDQVDWLSSCERITQRIHVAVQEKICDAFPSGGAPHARHDHTVAPGGGGSVDIWLPFA